MLLVNAFYATNGTQTIIFAIFVSMNPPKIVIANITAAVTRVCVVSGGLVCTVLASAVPLADSSADRHALLQYSTPTEDRPSEQCRRVGRSSYILVSVHSDRE